MDALRKSIQSDSTPSDAPSPKTSAKKTTSQPAKSAATRRGLTLVGAKKAPARAAKSAGKRKSA
jgi:hypothetical protein